MQRDYNVTRHDYTVKQHDYNVKRHDYIPSSGMIIMISRMIINSLNTIKAHQASPKLCEMEAKQTIALNFTGSNRE